MIYDDTLIWVKIIQIEATELPPVLYMLQWWLERHVPTSPSPNVPMLPKWVEMQVLPDLCVPIM